MAFFLVDASLSPKLAEELRKLGYEAKAVRETALKSAEDVKIVEYAIKNNAVVITGDLDFGELWYWYYGGKAGIIVFRMKSYIFENQFKILKFLHNQGILKDKKIETSLIISREHRYRIRTV